MPSKSTKFPSTVPTEAEPNAGSREDGPTEAASSVAESAPDSAGGDSAPATSRQGAMHTQSEQPTKMSQATDIYRRMSRKKGTARKEIVTAFIDEVGLTKSGAATYYQMIKKGRR